MNIKLRKVITIFNYCHSRLRGPDIFILLFCLLISPIAHAYSYSNYYCEKNFKSVSVGATMDIVRAACGEPTSTITKQIPVQTPINVVRWIYTLGLLSIDGVSLNLPSLTVTFSNNQVVEISRNNMPVSSSGYCNINGVINIGDSINTVLRRCGRPNFINQQQTMQTTNKEVIEWIYNFGPYRQQVLFDFENGTLSQIIMGQLGN
jgi:hypothetical protein